MRSLEIGLYSIHMLVLVWCVIFKWSRWQAIGAGITTLFSMIQIVTEGYRWQMLSVYGVALLLALNFLRALRAEKTSSAEAVVKSPIRLARHQNAGWRRMLVFLLLTVYIAISGLLPVLMPVFSFASPTGPYPVGTTALYLEDAGRSEKATANSDDKRRLMIQVWYPANEDVSGPRAVYIENVSTILSGIHEAISLPPLLLEQLQYVKSFAYKDAEISSRKEQFPLLVFSHGLTGFRNQNTFQVEELASQGYIVVGIDHPYDAAAVVYPDQTVSLLKMEGLSGFEEYVDKSRVWVEDTVFVLDVLEGKASSSIPAWLASKIDMNRVGAFGHSFGGATAAQMLLEDSRIKAALNMDGILYGEPIPDNGFELPYMQMNAEQSVDYEWFSRSLDQAIAVSGRTGEHYERFWEESDSRRQRAVAGENAYSLIFKATNHMSFTDFYLYSPLLYPKDAPPKSVHKAINQLSLAFFDRYLKGDKSKNIQEIADQPGLIIN